MGLFASFVKALAAATLVIATPTPSSPVSGLKYDLITRDEILARLSTSTTDANDVLAKRTPGNVSSPPGPRFGRPRKLTRHVDLHVHRQ